MNTLLIFFALPIAVIIFSIILQRIFRCPFIVASIIFAVFLIVAFVIGTFEALVAAIAYTLLSLLTAYIVMLLCRINWDEDEENNNCNRRRCCCQNNSNEDNNIITTSINGDINTANNSFNGTYSIGRNGTTCSCRQVDNNTITVMANIEPTSNTNGRRGRFCGTYR